jgi:hypothetical protein
MGGRRVRLRRFPGFLGILMLLILINGLAGFYCSLILMYEDEENFPDLAIINLDYSIIYLILLERRDSGASLFIFDCQIYLNVLSFQNGLNLLP